MSSRLLTAVEAFLKHLEHLVGLEPTASVQAHIPVPELTELRAAHAEASSAPPVEPPAATESPTPPPAETPSAEGTSPEAAPAATAAPETEPPPA